ncbi:hypothetical protein [Gaoshiqia sp. Z1-71]|uniref:hypothetical protein n=1 Tax=Gaoshiqia hydrogeniformans TaxID=3290090 RepID=UPI003BF91014
MKTERINYMILLLCSFLFAAGSCEKDKEPQLPPITQTGAGTFGCLIDGQIWVAGSDFFGKHTGANNTSYEDERWVIFAPGSLYDMNIEICKESMIDGFAVLDGTRETSCSNGVLFQGLDYEQFWTVDGNTGTINITKFDPDAKIISGTFAFDAVNSEGVKKEIRDGRFDIKIRN